MRSGGVIMLGMMWWWWPLLALTTLDHLAAASSCPVAGYTRNPTNGHCYRVTATSQRYTPAEAECEKDGGYLASVHSDADNSAILSLGQNINLNVWLGVVCVSNDTCVWTDGTPFDYQSFYSGKPNVAFGKCAYLLTADADVGKWANTDCSASAFAYICQLSSKEEVSCPASYVQFGSDCFRSYGVAADSQTAQQTCANDGATLASIHNQAVNDFISLNGTSAVGGADLLIGLYTPDGTNYTWRDGSSYDFSNFIPSFPNNRLGACVQLLSEATSGASFAGKWINFDCSDSSAFVCHTAASASGQTTVTPPIPLSPSTQSPASCPTNNFFNDQGILYSPSYPQYYSNNLSCEYVLLAPVGDRMNIRFSVFQTQANYDFVRLYEGYPIKTLLAELSGAIDTSRVFTTNTSNIMTMTFTTDATIVDPGFVAQYYSTGPIPVTTGQPMSSTTVSIVGPASCPNSAFVGNGTIASPHYPNLYDNNLNCAWILESIPQDDVVELIFEQFRTESCCDIVSIYDGNTTNNGNLLGRLSGVVDTSTQRFRSSGRFLTVSFITDSNVQDTGFAATYSSVPFTFTFPPFTTTPHAGANCPSGFVSGTGTNKCYQLFAIGGVFSRNEAACWAAGWRTLSIHSNLEAANVYALISAQLGANQNQVYLGLQNGTWTDSSQLDFTDWLPGEPNAQAGSCGAINARGTRGWLMVPCETALAYICETTAV